MAFTNSKLLNGIKKKILATNGWRLEKNEAQFFTVISDHGDFQFRIGFQKHQSHFSGKYIRPSIGMGVNQFHELRYCMLPLPDIDEVNASIPAPFKHKLAASDRWASKFRDYIYHDESDIEKYWDSYFQHLKVGLEYFPEIKTFEDLDMLLGPIESQNLGTLMDKWVSRGVEGAAIVGSNETEIPGYPMISLTLEYGVYAFGLWKVALAKHLDRDYAITKKWFQELLDQGTPDFSGLDRPKHCMESLVRTHEFIYPHINSTFNAITGKYVEHENSKTDNFPEEKSNNSIVKKLETQDDRFEFTENTKFLESLRLDVSEINRIHGFHINSDCEILLLTDNYTIIKLNSNGDFLLEKQIQPNVGYDRFLNVKSGIISDTGEFYVNNYIITKNNHIRELPLPKSKVRKKLQDPHIIDLAYSAKNNSYYILYQNNMLTYSADGDLLKSIEVKGNYYNKIIPEKEWITVQKDDSLSIVDFNGVALGEYSHSDGNNKYQFSESHKYLLCHFYTVKSQFYNLLSGTKETIWAHPTYIKSYKETLYPDTHNNFGINVAEFSPDCKYLIGGAEHGKYVAWLLPDLKRIELIPQTAVLDQFEPCNRYEGSQLTLRVTKPELVKLKNQIFLNNRRNEMSKIIFIENGDFFLTEIGYGKFILTWDRNFNNINCRKIDGRIECHSNEYFSKRNDKELVVYKLE